MKCFPPLSSESERVRDCKSVRMAKMTRSISSTVRQGSSGETTLRSERRHGILGFCIHGGESGGREQPAPRPRLTADRTAPTRLRRLAPTGVVSLVQRDSAAVTQTYRLS
ncbi:hypothetical protein FA95DRAFT_1016697 [Auriscalpium vulgare]|uniref:Uncharacterized protein n=1 Tax=Auriscalpium vulgare TaxID=40419 RepID=A0ACB8RXY7_9AGAM|nr:hypothetical protein FA95DRAFT_1016697 [Auriscalpium vulgare]